MYKNILSHNYIEWKENIKTDPNWIPPIDQEFIPHILPVLASISFQYNTKHKIDPKLTYDNISDKVNTPNGIIEGKQLKALLGFSAIARRSVLLPKTTQVKHPQYGIYTPLAMYAQKLYNNIGYDKWDTTPSPYLHAFLGSTLYNAYVSAKNNGKPMLSNINTLRKEALTFKSGVNKGNQDKATAHRCNLLTLEVQTRNGIEKKKYNKYAVISFLQLWITNVELRNEEAMILDLYDWGNIPKALDATFSRAPTKELKVEQSAIDELWSIL